jgi:formylglycine-generating enzyme required for sulfatase activity/Tol biopolymer transport system component
MPGLSVKLYNRTRETLLRCREFESNGSLRAVFATAELLPFKDGLKDADNIESRVDLFLDYIPSQTHKNKGPVLPIFLDVLRQRYPTDNALRSQLDNIYQGILSEFGLPQPEESEARPPHTNPDSPKAETPRLNQQPASTTPIIGRNQHQEPDQSHISDVPVTYHQEQEQQPQIESKPEEKKLVIPKIVQSKYLWLGVGSFLVVGLCLLLWQSLRCILEYRLTEPAVGLIVFLAGCVAASIGFAIRYKSDDLNGQPNDNNKSSSGQKSALGIARRALEILEEQAAGYGSLAIPPHLQIQLEDKRREVARLEESLKLTNITSTVSPFTEQVPLFRPTLLHWGYLAIGASLGLLVMILLGYTWPHPPSPEECKVFITSKLEKTSTPIATARMLLEKTITPSTTPSPSETSYTSTSSISPSPVVSPISSPIPVSPIPVSSYVTLPRKAAPALVWPKDNMELVFVPEGPFLMGSSDDDAQAYDNEKPQHSVSLDAFWIDRTEVTNSMYARCVSDGVCEPPKLSPEHNLESDGGNYPVVGVTWADAQTYCQWAGRRLPTEAEWEKAARGTDGRLYPWGDAKPSRDRSLYSIPEEQDYPPDFQPVGSFPNSISPYGALDMAGNVWEWTSDWFNEGYYQVSPDENPVGAPNGDRHVLRGGAWNEDVRYLRVANRGSGDLAFGEIENNAGIRCAISANQVSLPIYSAPAQKDSMQQIFIPSGEFMMGRTSEDDKKESPAHKIFLDAFWIDQTEITNAMFKRFVGETGYRTEAEKNGGYWYAAEADQWINTGDWTHPYGATSNIEGLDDHPVVQISWPDAAAYCEWVGRRLPTEAEWEKAARGIDLRLYPWGENEPTDVEANFADQNDGTSPVGNYPAGASPYRVLDMAGNVWEWTADWYQENYYEESPSNNPPGPEMGNEKVLRGGGWRDSAWNIRTTIRRSDWPEIAVDSFGFRCAQSIGKPIETFAFDSNKPGNSEIFIINSDGTGLLQLTDNLAEDYDPAWSPDGTQIAFVSNREGDYQLYAMGSDGQNQHRVFTDTLTNLSRPSWSPDGEWIAFASGWDIYKVKADGGNLTKLTFNPANDRDPVWSPDGKSILFLSDRNNAQDDFFVMDAEEGETRSIKRLIETDAKEQRGVWSADGKNILFIGNPIAGEEWNVYLMTNTGTAIHSVAAVEYESDPTFAPDGQRFAFGSSKNNRQIMLASLGSDAPSELQTGLARSIMPAWSPVKGDERIAFVGLNNGDWEIYTLSQDRTYPLRLTENNANDGQPHISPDGQWVAFSTNEGGDRDEYKICIASAIIPNSEWRCLTDNKTDDRYPSWSPDGTQLAFASDRDGDWDIYRISVQGGDAIQLTDDPSLDRFPNWSPDGSYIVFASYRNGNEDIFRMDFIDGNNLAMIDNNAAYDWSPSISPDGNFLLFTSSRDSGNAYQTEIYVKNLKSGKVMRLTNNDASDPVAFWSSDGRQIYFISTLHDGILDIWVMNADGSNLLNLTEDKRDDDY